MNRRIFGIKSFTKALCLALVVVVLGSILTKAITNPPEDEIIVPAAVISGTPLNILDRVADPSTSGLGLPPYLSRNVTGFVDAPVHDGRIWTDKTVSVGSGTDDFNVVLSALAQTFPNRAGFVIPADTVFVIDVSGSMTTVDPGTGGRSRIELLIDALNEAMQIMLSSNTQNRVAVVAYGGVTGGYARVENVLPLGRHAPNAAGNFFSYNAAGPYHLRVESGTPRNILVQGSTPTQWGIREGARILEGIGGNREVSVPVTNPDGTSAGNVNVTRRPNIILMTDGEPTMGRADFAFDTPDPVMPGPNGGQLIAPNIFYGDGSYGETGVSLMTVLTAAYRQRTVQDSYFPAGWDTNQPPNQPEPGVGFYTISVGTQPTSAAQSLINAAMNPFGSNAPAPAGTANADHAFPRTMNTMNLGGAYPSDAPNDSMGALLRQFAANPLATITFRAQYRESFGNYQWAHPNSTVTIANNVNLTEQELAFNDLFFQATNLDELRDAFLSITNSIQQTSNHAVIDGPESGGGAGYIVFSDVLGEYMEFRNLTGLYFNGDSFVPGWQGFRSAMTSAAERAAFENVLRDQLNYGIFPGQPAFVNVPEVTALIDSNMASARWGEGNLGSIKYFADGERNLLGSFFNSDGTEAPLPPAAAVTVEMFPLWGSLEAANAPLGADTHFMNLAFHVVTALGDNTSLSEIFVGANRVLNTGEQLIRWYIPAELIPMRRVVVGVDGSTAVAGQTLPIRVSYTVGLNNARVAAGVSEAYISANPGPNGSIFFYSNRFAEPNSAFAHFRPGAGNPYYHGDGERITPKSANPTETAGYVRRPVGSHPEITHRLGNNGRLRANLLGQAQITKIFSVDFESLDGSAPPPVTPITFTIIIPDSENITRTFPDNFVWNSVERRWELEPAQIPTLTSGTYTVTKIGGAHTDVEYTHLPQPGVTTVTVPPGGLGIARFANEYFSPIDPEHLPALRLRKLFHPENADPPNFAVTIEELNSAYPVTSTSNSLAIATTNSVGNSINWERNASGNWQITLDRTQATAGVTLTELRLGEYRITEVSLEAPGFTLEHVAWYGRNLMNQEPVFGTASANGLADFRIDIVIDNNSDNWVIRLDNFYTPTNGDNGPPSPPTPPTFPLSPPPTGNGDVVPPVPITPGVSLTQEPDEPAYPPSPEHPVDPGYPVYSNNQNDTSTPVDPSEPEVTTASPSPQTSDDRPITLYLALLIAGIVLICSAVWLRTVSSGKKSAGKR